MVRLPVLLLDLQETHVDTERHIKDPGAGIKARTLSEPSQEVFQFSQRGFHEPVRVHSADSEGFFRLLIPD